MLSRKARALWYPDGVGSSHEASLSMTSDQPFKYPSRSEEKIDRLQDRQTLTLHNARKMRSSGEARRRGTSNPRAWRYKRGPNGAMSVNYKTRVGWAHILFSEVQQPRIVRWARKLSASWIEPSVLRLGLKNTLQNSPKQRAQRRFGVVPSLFHPQPYGNEDVQWLSLRLRELPVYERVSTRRLSKKRPRATRLAEQMRWFSGKYLTWSGRTNCWWCGVETPTQKLSKSNQPRS